MKKLLLLLTALLLGGASAFAQGGTTGPLTWNLSESTLTINGNGEMPNYSRYDDPAPWHSYRLSINTIVIGIGVTSIGHYAFDGCTYLTFVTIPNSVTNVGDAVFSDCRSLPSIAIPNSVTNIGDAAFSSCSSLTSLIIPDGVTSIGMYAFGWCGLTSITIGNSVTSIEIGTFYQCHSLTSVTIGNSVTRIENYAFYFCNNLTSVTIPNSVTSIGNSAFGICSSLTSVIIPNSVTSIGNYAFDGCSLTSVTIPNSVTSIGISAFYSYRLTSINVDNNNPNYSSIDGILYNKVQDTLIQYPSKKTGTEFIIPNSVIIIGENAFYACDSLISVTIPNSVTGIGIRAFMWCTGLRSIISKAITPPVLEWSAFGYSDMYGSSGNVNNKIPIYIPSGSIIDYQIDWSYFYNFYEIYLDFDTYTVTKWNNTFMLNLNKLSEEDYAIATCKWFKNNKLIGEGFTWSAGSKITDQLEVGAIYTFELTTHRHGKLFSTDKVIASQSKVLRVYPNPVPQGNKLTIEGTIMNTPVEVYNLNGVCVSRTTATGSVTELILAVPAGVYVVRTNNEEVKVIIQ